MTCFLLWPWGNKTLFTTVPAHYLALQCMSFVKLCVAWFQWWAKMPLELRKAGRRQKRTPCVFLLATLHARSGRAYVSGGQCSNHCTEKSLRLHTFARCNFTAGDYIREWWIKPVSRGFTRVSSLLNMSVYRHFLWHVNVFKKEKKNKLYGNETLLARVPIFYESRN